MTTKMRARLEARPSSYARLDAEGRAAFDAYDGPVSCGPPSDLAARDAEIAGLKVRAEKAEANYAFMVKRAAHLSTLSARVVEAAVEALDAGDPQSNEWWLVPGENMDALRAAVDALIAERQR